MGGTERVFGIAGMFPNSGQNRVMCKLPPTRVVVELGMPVCYNPSPEYYSGVITQMPNPSSVLHHITNFTVATSCPLWYISSTHNLRSYV